MIPVPGLSPVPSLNSSPQANSSPRARHRANFPNRSIVVAFKGIQQSRIHLSFSFIDRRMDTTGTISGSDNTHELPVYKLPTDILSHIFVLNAYMDQDQAEVLSESVSKWRPRALTMIRDASQVCRSWRNLILSSPTLWGKLIDIDYLSRTPEEAAQEILSPADNAARSLLSRLLEANWDRIEKLLVLVFETESTESDHWPQFYLPARSLKLFQFYFVPYFIMKTVLPFDGRRLFDGVAPQLRSFDLGSRIEFNPGASWLSHIRHLNIDDAPMPLSRWLEALNATKMLESLIIRSSSMNQWSPDLATRRLVRLPFLARLAISHRLFDVAALLGNLELPPRCGVGITATGPEYINSPADIDLVKDVLSTYAKAWTTYYTEQPELRLSVSSHGFCVKQSIRGTERNPLWCFRLDVSCSSNRDLDTVLPNLDAFAEINFDHISELTLNISVSRTMDMQLDVDRNPDVPRFISRLQNVEGMYTSIESVDTLSRMTQHHPILLPMLSRLRLWEIYRISGELMGPENVPAQVLLDLTHCDGVPDLSSLDDMAKGIKIRWRYAYARGCKPEYICGSGRQDILADLCLHKAIGDNESKIMHNGLPRDGSSSKGHRMGMASPFTS
ncbi:unnamed protein product [Cyclocybe aegerita]|uniref:F-box domain-containing protein n=1 Tax=Cyclocybe aegerita TaxID=1973307 RepID=A0A8S0W5I7_CYCAE|nr:unnamed protein product [Cyclocybe aegerita]